MLKAAKDRATWLNLLYTAVAVKKNKIKKRKEDINFLSIVPLKTTTSPCSPDAQNKTYIQAVFLMWFVAEFMEPFFLIIFGVYSRKWRWVIGELDNLPDVDEMCMKRWRKKKTISNKELVTCLHGVSGVCLSVRIDFLSVLCDRWNL